MLTSARERDGELKKKSHVTIKGDLGHLTRADQWLLGYVWFYTATTRSSRTATRPVSSFNFFILLCPKYIGQRDDAMPICIGYRRKGRLPRRCYPSPFTRSKGLWTSCWRWTDSRSASKELLYGFKIAVVIEKRQAKMRPPHQKKKKKRKEKEAAFYQI